MNREILWTSTEADAIAGGKSTQNWSASNVCIKVADVKPGDLFFAAPDDDLDLVFARGAAAAVVPLGTPGKPGQSLLHVANVFEAMYALGRAARYKTHATVLAIQGQQERLAIAQALSLVGFVHTGRRSMAFALSGLPEICDFGVFGFSPYIRPDVAVVTDGAATLEDPVFESMPDNGIVLINTDDMHCRDVMAHAKAAGIRNILTFGSSALAEARLLDSVAQGNTNRIKAMICGESVNVVLSADMPASAALVALLMVKLSGYSLQAFAARITARTWENTPFDPDVSLWDKAFLQKRAPAHEALFRVANIVDWGFGRRMLVLDNAEYAPALSALKYQDMQIPKKIQTMNVICAAREVPVFSDARAAFSAARTRTKIEDIVPEVLAPGDLVVFRKIWKSSKAVFSGALRIVTPSREGVIKSDHAI